MKPNFVLGTREDNGKFRLLIIKNQIIDEEELENDLSPVFHRVNSSLNNITGNFFEGLSYNQSFKSGPKWILTEPDSDGVSHCIGISVHARLLKKLIVEMNHIGYRIVNQRSEVPAHSRELNSRYI